MDTPCRTGVILTLRGSFSAEKNTNTGFGRNLATLYKSAPLDLFGGDDFELFVDVDEHLISELADPLQDLLGNERGANDDDDACILDAITDEINSSDQSEAAPALASSLASKIPVISSHTTASIFAPYLHSGGQLTRKQRVERWKAKRLKRDWSKKRHNDPAFSLRQGIAAKRQRNNGRFTAAKTVWVTAAKA